MSGSRTEKPTPRRLREARRRGEVAMSREVTGLAALLAGGAALAATAPRSAARLAAHLRASLAATGGELTPEVAGPAVAQAAGLLLSALAPVLLAAAAGALAAGLLQTRWLVAPSAAGFRGERLHPVKNLRKAFSVQQLVSIAVALAKALVGLAVAITAARDATKAAAALPRLEAGALLGALPRLLAPMVLRGLLLLLAFAALDLFLTRRRYERGLRMTREEVRREHKEDEGDPRHKTERRRRHRALLDAAPLSRATCVVVNPTHIAIALFHDRAGDRAPLVVGKGAGAEAAAIRSAARRAGVPIVRDVPLARALFRLADLGEEIPEELYEAAAAVLVHVHGLAPEILS